MWYNTEIVLYTLHNVMASFTCDIFSVLPPLVEALINHSETCLLHSAFHSLSEIPEVCLCKALQYYLM